MRVIQTSRNNNYQNRSIKNKAPLLVLIISIFCVVSIMLMGYLTQKPANTVNAQLSSLNSAPKENLTDAEFNELLQRVRLPNTKQIISTPKLTDSLEADNRIRQIIESRGFRLTSVPTASFASFSSNNQFRLQPLAEQAWSDMKTTASQQNIPLEIQQSLVTVEDSQVSLTEALRRQKISTAQIIAKQADDLLVQIIMSSDLPGYSWLHTGYAISVSCASGVQDFKTTRCFKWLTENNYANAKRFGWIPIIVNNNGQGDFRANQFVWVGQENTK